MHATPIFLLSLSALAFGAVVPVSNQDELLIAREPQDIGTVTRSVITLPSPPPTAITDPPPPSSTPSPTTTKKPVTTKSEPALTTSSAKSTTKTSPSPSKTAATTSKTTTKKGHSTPAIPPPPRAARSLLPRDAQTLGVPTRSVIITPRPPRPTKTATRNTLTLR